MTPLEKPEAYGGGSVPAALGAVTLGAPSGFSSGAVRPGPVPLDRPPVKIYCHGEDATAGFFDGSWLCQRCGDKVAVVA